MSAVLVQTIGLMRRNRIPPFVPPVVGELYLGGYFTGIITDGSIRYRLLLGPKDSGYYVYKSAGTAAPAACQTLTNGKAATDAMISAGTAYNAANAAKTARTNNTNGYNDWYVPARNELELCYRNLKPTTGANHDGNYPTATYFGGGGVNGTNPNSDPYGSGYSLYNPLQTTVTLFKSGGDQAFDLTTYANYWTSTEASASNAWTIQFNNGLIYHDNKTANGRLRLMRRVAV